MAREAFSIFLLVSGTSMLWAGWYLWCFTRGVAKWKARYCEIDRERMRLPPSYFYDWGNPFSEYNGPGNW